MLRARSRLQRFYSWLCNAVDDAAVRIAAQRGVVLRGTLDDTLSRRNAASRHGARLFAVTLAGAASARAATKLTFVVAVGWRTRSSSAVLF